MSMPTAQIVCTGCDYEASELYRPVRICYQTASGKIVETVRTKGWCYGCAGYSDIEDMNQERFSSQLVEKEQERLEVRNRQEQLNHGFLSGFRHRSKREQLQFQLEYLDEEITKLGELIDIAKRRVSKARCLKCWSDRTVPLTFSSEEQIAYDFQHDCGGNLQKIDDPMGIRFHFRLAIYTLTEEGELLDKEPVG